MEFRTESRAGLSGKRYILWGGEHADSVVLEPNYYGPALSKLDFENPETISYCLSVNEGVVGLSETDMLTLFAAFLEIRSEHYGLEG